MTSSRERKQPVAHPADDGRPQDGYAGDGRPEDGYGSAMTADMPLPPLGTPPLDPLALLLRSDPDTVFDYLEFRQLLAGPAAAFAAERATPADLAHLRHCLRAVEEAHAQDDPVREAAADAAFHLAIYETAHNPVMTHIMRRLIDMLRQGMAQEGAPESDTPPLRRGVRENFLRQHQAIFDAMAAHDPAAARGAVEAHLASSAEALREALRAQSRRDLAQRRRNGAEFVVAKNKRAK